MISTLLLHDNNLWVWCHLSLGILNTTVVRGRGSRVRRWRRSRVRRWRLSCVGPLGIRHRRLRVILLLHRVILWVLSHQKM